MRHAISDRRSTSPVSANPGHELTSLRRRLFEHPLYARVNHLQALRCFMREHVFAVWDFMSLLRRLQTIVTHADLPWRPPADPESARFILEILLGEEADEDGRGGYLCHFELYRQAMLEVGAETGPIDHFLNHLSHGAHWHESLQMAPVLPSTRKFVEFTLHVALDQPPHVVAAVFCHGREDIIPEMFSRLVSTLEREQGDLDRFRHYLHRHIELDGDRHGPLAEQLLQRLCAGDPLKIRQAREAACQAIEERIALWDGILAALP